MGNTVAAVGGTLWKNGINNVKEELKVSIECSS